MPVLVTTDVIYIESYIHQGGLLEFIFDFSTNKEIMNQLEKDNKILIFLFCFFATGM